MGLLGEVMAQINATFCSVVCGYQFFKNTIRWDEESDQVEQWAVNFSLSYFWADTLFGLFYNTLTKDRLAHHFGVLIGLAASTTYGLFSFECSLSLVLAEFSNIFLSAREVLKYYQMESGALYVFNGIMFIISFLILRILGSLFLMPHLQSDPRKPLILNISAIILFWVSWQWVFQVINLGVKFFHEAYPDVKGLKKVYGFLKVMRKPRYMMIYYIIVTWFTTRHFIRAKFDVQWI